MRDAILIVIAIVVAASAFGGQEYRSSVELVTVPLTVTGRDRAPVSAPLTPSDFQVSPSLRPIVRSKLTA